MGGFVVGRIMGRIGRWSLVSTLVFLKNKYRGRKVEIKTLMGATLSTLLRAVHPGTIAMADFRQRLRPKVLTRHLGDL